MLVKEAKAFADTVVTVTAEGANEDAAIAALTAFFNNNLHETSAFHF